MTTLLKLKAIVLMSIGQSVLDVRRKSINLHFASNLFMIRGRRLTRVEGIPLSVSITLFE